MLFRISHAPTPIVVPYLRPPDDPQSHSYIDLKKNPEQLTLIPEISEWPELESTLVELNRPLSPFSTIGCEKCICGEGPYGVSGYVQFRLEDLSLAINENSYVRLLSRLYRKAVAGWPRDDATVELELQKTASDDRDELYWSAALWLIVRGCDTSDRAKMLWSAALRFIRESLLENGFDGLKPGK